MLFGNGLVGDYTFAAQLVGNELFSTQCHLPPTPNVHYSACLMVRRNPSVIITTAAAAAAAGCYLLPRYMSGGPRPLISGHVQHCAERMFTTNKVVWPIQRTLLATGVNAAGMRALKDGGRVAFKGLESVTYSVTDEPRFAGGGGLLG